MAPGCTDWKQLPGHNCTKLYSWLFCSAARVASLPDLHSMVHETECKGTQHLVEAQIVTARHSHIVTA